MSSSSVPETPGSGQTGGVGRCPECGCPCQNCRIAADGAFAYQQEEIEKLRSLARGQQSSITRLETDLHVEAESRARDQQKLQDELLRLRDRYDRLLESHKKLSRVNAGLEERLLSIAERCQSGKEELAACQQRLSLSEAEGRIAREEASQMSLRLQHQAHQQMPSGGDSGGVQASCAASWTGPAGLGSVSQLSQPPVVASVSVPLPTFPPTFAHVSPQRPPLPPPQPPPLTSQPPRVASSTVLHL